ncbi:metal-dependent hydrolase [Halalkalibacter alkalisediminis]|uniref:Metal-dependent hydrolase n=1 Tax=Halalkalibacter alkalisediminis TaxID=935616 RepID=A0ABV6NQR4_9BACI|nr:metal-dependent hydrolase [Halalkalibacter alkalisediminis]
MDTITHALFGLTSYGAVNKGEMDRQTKKALLFSAIAASQIPDIDVVASVTETGRIMEQMWHRGLTHSFFLAPIWALLIYVVSYLIWKRKDRMIYYLALLNVFIHNASDSLNAWGTGAFEPFSDIRVSFGVISIVDFFIWFVMFAGFLVIRMKKNFPRHRIWKIVWLVIVFHVSLQSIQGYLLLNEAKGQYQEVALSAGFAPGQFSLIGKENETVTIYDATIWRGKDSRETLYSHEDADLELLFQENPKAEVLKQWSPFVVVVETDQKLGIFDPRFYRNGESFLFEYIEFQ